jgi:carbamoyl-phosphate synthase large subunit
MSQKLNIAVTGVGGGCGQGIVKALRMSKLPISIFPTDITGLSAGLHTGAGGHVLPRPEQNLNAWREWVSQYQITAIIPGSDHDLAPLCVLNDLLVSSLYGKVLVSDLKAIEIANDKAHTAKALYELDIPYPASTWAHKTEGMLKTFPMVVKPRFGMTSRGLNIAHDDEELAFYWKRTDNPIAQEYIEGDEFTCGLFFNGTPRLGALCVMKRDLYAGTTYRAETGCFPEVEAFCHDFAAKTWQWGWRGAINVQLRWHPERGGVVIEINARASGSTAIRAAMGYNEPEMMLRQFVLHEVVEQPHIKRGVALRYWNELILEGETFEQLKQRGRGIRGKVVQW